MNGSGEKLLNPNHEEEWKSLYVIKTKLFQNHQRKIKQMKNVLST